MSRLDAGKKSKRMGRPPVDSEEVSTRMERKLLSALDAYAASSQEVLTRPKAVRAILTDWLAGHGFLKQHEKGEDTR